MNISKLSKFSCYKVEYQIIYCLILSIIIVLLILELLFFKNVVSIDYKGVVSQNTNLIISNLEYSEVETILESKRIEIASKKVKYKVLEVNRGLTNYVLKLKLDNFYLDSRTLNLKVVLKEENLYQFIIRKLKGE